MCRSVIYSKLLRAYFLIFNIFFLLGLGSPLLFSLPHFLWADDKYLDGVKGLSPDPDKHMLFLNVEPVSNYYF